MGYSQVKVTTNGNTIVGNTATVPTAQLQIDGTFGAGGQLFRATNGSSGFFGVTNGTGTGFLPVFDFSSTGNGSGGLFNARVLNDVFVSASAAVQVRMVQGSGSGKLLNANLFQVKNFNTVAMTVTPAGPRGRVGIGTTAPSEALTVQGNILATGTVTGMSDRRLKKNINNFDLGLDAILAIQPKTYQYNGKGGINDTESTHVGIIAQDLAEIYPNSVKPVMLTENESAIEIAEEKALTAKNIDGDLSLDGLPKLETQEYLSVNDKSITYMLVNAIKEQQDMIDAQADQISQLTEMITTITTNGIGNVTEVDLEYFDFAELGLAAPNPTDDFTNIEYTIPNDAETATMNIMDNSGRIIRVVNLNDQRGNGVVKLNVNQIPGGTYNYQLIVDGRNIGTKKIVVAK
ncbi:tail fiber domain-containing protein [Saprospiraceae bacterium]|nr:tail fiber domain-containing protein [Saprospiraceae bacterium]